MLASKIEIHEDKIANINYLNLTILLVWSLDFDIFMLWSTIAL